MDATRSPLHERHVALGAKFSEFGGWEMPLEYSGIVKEHTAVRDAVGIFDVSHLGKLEVTGAGAAEFVNSCLTADLGRIGRGQAQYTLCCDEETGGIIDDLIVYRHDDDHLLLVPNAANSDEVRRRLEADLPAGVQLSDEHTTRTVIAVQGSGSDEVLTAIDFPVGHDYMSFVVAPFQDATVSVCRTGYTGERGYELIAPAEVSETLWDALLRAGEPHGMLPCGLGARDTLRLEMGYPLHGQDLTPAVSPNQTRLGWAVGWDKPAFWGKQALVAEKERGTTVTLRGLRARGRGIPRQHMAVRVGDDTVGEVTSGTFSPTLRTGIALALIDKKIEQGSEVQVDVRGRAEPFEVVRPPFVSSGVRNS